MNCPSEEKILCPWCGAEMKNCTKILGSKSVSAMECRLCGAKGPAGWGFTNREAEEAARGAALRRYTPPLKPMTLEEAFGRTVNVELKDGGRVRRITLSVEASMARTIEIIVPWNISQEDAVVLAKDNYGKTWRCWERRPTDEERSAAEWKD